MDRFAGLLLAVMSVITLCCPVRHAVAETPPEPSLVGAQLVSEAVSIRPGHPFWVAVRLEIKDGWHVNWINPGDAGLAPKVEWELPSGFEAEDIQWPYPQRFPLPGLLLFGYEKHVLLMARIRTPQDIPDDRVALRASVDWLACREACIPGEARLALELPVREQKPQNNRKWAPEFESTRRRIPAAESEWRFSARVTDERIVISAAPSNGNTIRIKEMIFYPAAQGVVEHALEQKLKKTVRGYDLDIARARMSLAKPQRIRGVLVSREGWGPGVEEKALQIDVPVK